MFGGQSTPQVGLLGPVYVLSVGGFAQRGPR